MLAKTRKLSETEKEERNRLERRIKKCYYVSCLAIYLIKRKNLYRDKAKNITDYCAKEFSIKSKSKTYRFIAVGAVIAGILKREKIEVTDIDVNCLEEHLKNKKMPIFPTREKQIREIIEKVEPQYRVEVWLDAVDRSNGEQPSKESVTEAINKHHQNRFDGVFASSLQTKEGLLSLPSAAKDTVCLSQKAKPQYLGDGEYSIVIREETYRLLEENRQKLNKLTIEGAITALLPKEDIQEQIEKIEVKALEKENAIRRKEVKKLLLEKVKMIDRIIKEE